MNTNRTRKSLRFILITLLFVLLLLNSSCITAGEKDEAELIESLLQKVAAMDGEMNVVTKNGDNITITLTKEASIENDEVGDIIKDKPKNTEIGKSYPSSIDVSNILPPLDNIEDVFKVLEVWEDAHMLHEKGLSWHHAAAELGYHKDTMHAELLEIAEERLKDAKESGLISSELLEKKLAYFNDIALKWVNKIFTDTEEEEKSEEKEIEKFDGVIKAIDGHIWKVMNEDEVWVVDVSKAEIIRKPEVGLKAFIVGVEKENIIVALEAEIEVTEEKETVIDFYGIIKTMDGQIWKMYVEDEVRIVDVSEALIRLEPEVGQKVLVAGIFGEDSIIALEVDEAEE